MQYRELGKTGLNSSVLGFGLMRLPTVPHCEEKIPTVDFEKTKELYYKGLELGINYFDTAFVYHGEQSEKILGKLIKESNKRKDIILSTKLPCSKITATEHFERFFSMQLENLQTDYIDVYLMHGLNRTRWEFMKKLGALEFLEQKKKEGRINHIGFSFHDSVDVLEDIVDEYDFEVGQIQLNYIDTNMQAGIQGFSYMAGKGMGIIIMEPLKGGTLAQNVPPDIKEIWDTAEIKRSPAEWALRWLFDKKAASCVLSGMNEMAQLEENARIADEHKVRSLTSAEQNLYSHARAAMLSHAAIPCTGCKYCMPCGHGINIPNIFSLYNQLVMFKDKRWVAAQYNTAMANNESALKCKSCKKCMRKCPQSIDVPSCLYMAHTALKELCDTEKF